MDIKDIKRAMDNMPMGDGSAFAEISVGPAKHEQFLDEHYGKVALVVLLCVLGAAGWIIYNGVQDSMERKAGAALVAAMPESPANREISWTNRGFSRWWLTLTVPAPPSPPLTFRPLPCGTPARRMKAWPK